ncbi:hypothetical protein L209DRAFT_758979 [Thermothelomyces heterothallicus CBS 203.75]
MLMIPRTLSPLLPLFLLLAVSATFAPLSLSLSLPPSPPLFSLHPLSSRPIPAVALGQIQRSAIRLGLLFLFFLSIV